MKTFTSKLNKMNGARSSVYAQKAWLILIGYAVRRQTIRYAELAEMLGLKRHLGDQIVGDPRPLGHILGHIMFYCEYNELPLLNDLVVGADGKPGYRDKPDPAAQEKAFNYDWYNIIPPSAKAMRITWQEMAA